MVVIFCYIIMVYGFTNLMVYGYGPFDIIEHFRNIVYKISNPIGKMFECMMCTSTNIGLIISIIDLFLITNLNLTPFNYIFNDVSKWYFIIPFDMCFTSGAVWLIHTLQNYVEMFTKN